MRRQENKALMQEQEDGECLKGTKHSWLFNPENMSEDRWIDFDALKEQELKTSQARAIREQFRWFWEYSYAGNARKFFGDYLVLDTHGFTQAKIR